MNKYCFLVPVFNHTEGIRNTIARLAKYQLDCIVVNDGSEQVCHDAIATLARQHDWLHVIHRLTNCGKGAAVKAGLALAAELGFTHALQVDADEQHDLTAIAALIEQSNTKPGATILGVPVFDASVPKIRHISRYLTHIWVWINTLSFSIEDSMCGFRIYPLKPTLDVIDEVRLGDRMDFDTEILVRLHWLGMKFVSVPVNICYPVDGISHFHMVRDNWLITKMHTRLFFCMLPRLPTLLKRTFSG